MIPADGGGYSYRPITKPDGPRPQGSPQGSRSSTSSLVKNLSGDELDKFKNFLKNRKT